MKVAYIFMSDHAREILENMILPQMEAGVHGADVVGMYSSLTTHTCCTKTARSVNVWQLFLKRMV